MHLVILDLLPHKSKWFWKWSLRTGCMPWEYLYCKADYVYCWCIELDSKTTQIWGFQVELCIQNEQYNVQNQSDERLCIRYLFELLHDTKSSLSESHHVVKAVNRHPTLTLVFDIGNLKVECIKYGVQFPK